MRCSMEPNFLFIGPDKSGSTWLYNVLSQHPDCYVPAIKDIYYFDQQYKRGMDWYRSFFSAVSPQYDAVGEFSHDYLFSEVAARRIARDLPSVKLMTCLRNPVERSFSQYLFFIRSGLTRQPFEKAIKKFPQLIDNSLYFKHLSVYFRHFRRSQLGIFLFDDLKADPQGFACKVFKFLELPFSAAVDYGKKVLPASRPRNYLLAGLAKEGANLARALGLLELVGMVKTSRLVQLLYKPYDQNDRPTLHPETKHFLRELFAPDIQSLEYLLETDLSHWLSQETRTVY